MPCQRTRRGERKCFCLDVIPTIDFLGPRCRRGDYPTEDGHPYGEKAYSSSFKRKPSNAVSHLLPCKHPAEEEELTPHMQQSAMIHAGDI